MTYDSCFYWIPCIIYHFFSLLFFRKKFSYHQENMHKNKEMHYEIVLHFYGVITTNNRAPIFLQTAIKSRVKHHNWTVKILWVITGQI